MSDTDTKPFPLHAVLGVTTGRAWGGTFGDIHECAEHVMGHPIWSHEFASQPLWDEMRRRVLAAHPGLALVDYDGLSPENVADRLASAVAAFGATVTLPKGDAERTRSPVETAAEMVGEDRVMVVEVPGE